MEPDFPCLADEIAEPLPDKNIKFAAFTVNEKSSNSYGLFQITKGCEANEDIQFNIV